MSDAQSLAPVAVVVRHTVADFDTWKAAFDADEDARRAAGVLGHHINRGTDDPNALSVYLAASDIDRARAFASSDELQAAMEAAGVTSAPKVDWMTPVREAIVWDRELPAFMLTHRVVEGRMNEAIARIEALDAVKGEVIRIRMENLAG